MGKRNVNKVVNDFTEKKSITRDPIFLKTGSTLFDLNAGGSKGIMGVPFGNIYNIWGDSSSGKTFLAAEMVAQGLHQYKDKLKYNYDDCEYGCTINSQNTYGFDIVNKDTLRSKTVEELFTNIIKFMSTIGKDECGIYVVDSLDGLVAKETQDRGEDRVKAAESGKEFNEGTYAMAKQKYLSQEFFPILTSKISDSNVLLLIVSQTREKIGVTYGDKMTVNGGKAMQFYCHSRWKVRVTEQIENKGIAVMVRILVKAIKSKTSRPFRSNYVNIIFTYGVDNIGTNVEYLFDLVTDGGASTTGKESKLSFKRVSGFIADKDWFYKKFLDSYSTKEQRKDLEKLASDDTVWYIMKEDVIEYVENNNLEKKLEEAVISKWEAIEDSVCIVRKPKFVEDGV